MCLTRNHLPFIPSLTTSAGDLFSFPCFHPFCSHHQICRSPRFYATFMTFAGRQSPHSISTSSRPPNVAMGFRF
ncbi:hypothetical protein K461DRAFT_119017 [Myriangium duriaei CBS 260.36]|uniref:Uncharacterized protein n=1 Tax=Myriangium duriaei CBS 260.36 TaxID=1168546 RepID=A0A9P4J5P2_9PEZI|nr:hypothetical protein K461DRAFT_119017 [Myriangium duriaei CBS 260.36]